MNFAWFKGRWDQLSAHADDDINTMAAPYLARQAGTCTMMGGMRIIDELRRKSRGEGEERTEAHCPPGGEGEAEAVTPLTMSDVDNILGVSRHESVSGLFFCTRCKTKEHTQFNMRQTRGGDEGMTAFVHCRQCKHTWRR